jgi:hypothetical protein
MLVPACAEAVHEAVASPMDNAQIQCMALRWGRVGLVLFAVIALSNIELGDN